MGVVGLTTYVEEKKEEFFKNFRLHDCIVLIDGNSAACQIYTSSECNHIFGGDYDKFSNKIEEFIKILLKCNIIPVFVFDGAYENRKLDTVLERIKINIHICGHFKGRYKQSKCFPLMLRDVFKDTIRRLNLTIIQCNFEADQELIVISRLFEWPIISYDSDFLISEVNYIPFNMLELKLCKSKSKKTKTYCYLNCKIYTIDNLLNKFGGLNNKLFLLPLMSSLLGNDYIPINIFRHFLGIRSKHAIEEKIKKIVTWLQKIPSSDIGIREMLTAVPLRRKKWVSNLLHKLVLDYTRSNSPFISYIPTELLCHQILESSQKNSIKVNDTLNESDTNFSKKILGSSLENSVVKEDTEFFEESDGDGSDLIVKESIKIDDTLNESDTNFSRRNILDLSLENSVLEENREFFEESDESDDDGSDLIVEECIVICNPDDINENSYFEQRGSFAEGNNSISVDSVENLDKNVTNNLDKNIDENDTMEENFLTVSPKIPEWLYDHLCIGLLSPTILNIIYSKRIFIQSQSEDYKCPPSHEISLPIYQIIIGLILNDGHGNSIEKTVKCHARKFSCCYGIYFISPIFYTSSVGIEIFPTLNSIPETSLKLRRSIILDTIDNNLNFNKFPDNWNLFILSVIYWVKNSKFPLINKSHLRSIIICAIYLNIIDEKLGYVRNKKLLNKFKPDENADVTNFVNESADEKLLTDLMDQISKSDCLEVGKLLIDYHRLNEKLRENRESYNVKTTHAFAQLQSSLQSLIMLNGLLNFPFKNCETSKFFSGTFSYNLFDFLDKKYVGNNVDEYITNFFLSKSESVLRFYEMLIKILDPLCDFNDEVNLKKNKKSRRKSKKKIIPIEIEELKNESDGDSGDYVDSNNLYTLLSKCNITK